MKTKFILLGMSVWLILLSGCVSSQSSPDRSILNVKVIAAEMTTPLSIHFFTLKSNEVFKKLDYFELVSSKQIKWNDELISRAKTLLVPGHTEIFQVQLSSDIQYYALVIGFKDVEDNDNWRYIRAVESEGNNNIALRLSQENGYSSRVVQQTHKTQSSTKRNRSTTVVDRMGGKVSTKIDREASKAVDNTVNKIFGRIF